jgi:hypothetical protein
VKFRHHDRYIAGEHGVDRGPHGVVAKFEEDIKAPFISFYSFSLTSNARTDSPPRTIRDVDSLFRATKWSLTELEPDATLHVVNSPIVEVVYGGPSIQIGEHTAAECALILWYRSDAPGTTPLAAEFSYRYGNERGLYRGMKTHRAYDVFRALNSRLPKWVDTTLPTKTAIAYGQ